MTATLTPSAKQQFFDANGNPLAGGKLYTYTAGTTSPVVTYVDSAGVTTNTNPIILDSRGEANVWLGTGTFKFKLVSATDVEIWTVDNIPGAPTENAALVALAASNGSSLVGFIQSGTGAVATTVQTKLRETVSVKDFGAVGDGVANDTAAIQAAVTSLSAGQTLLFPLGQYKTNGVINVTTSNIGIHFDDCVLLIGDTGTSGTLTNSSSGKIGYLFKQANNLRVSGNVRCIGQGTLGVTSLSGMAFDSCDNAIVSAVMRFENMANGRFVLWCDDSIFGEISGLNIAGLQTFEAPPTTAQGTLEDVIGCQRSSFGNLICYGNILPARYLSVALDGSSAAVNNEYCRFGDVVSVGTGNSATALGVRSAKNCSFGSVTGTGLTGHVYLFIGSGTTTFYVDRNTFGDISGYGSATTEPENSIVLSISEEATNPIGSNAFGNINASGAGEFGVFLSSGLISLGNVTLSGFGRSFQITNSTVLADAVLCDGQANEAVLYGQGASISFGSISILSGATNATTAAIKYDSTIGSGGIGRINFGDIVYRHNSIGNNYLYPVMDLTNGFETTQINNIDGVGSGGVQARFASDEFFVKRGLYSSTTTPTSGTYSVGTVLWKSNAAAGGTPGWVCTTAGTPGTWKAMANLAV